MRKYTDKERQTDGRNREKEKEEKEKRMTREKRYIKRETDGVR